MIKYKASNLNAQTPKAEQSKLVTALKAVRGVENATLHLNTHEFEITARKKQEPKRTDIASAASKAGFALETR